MSLFVNFSKSKAAKFRQIVLFTCRRRVHEYAVPSLLENPFELIKWQHKPPVYEDSVLTTCRLKTAEYGDSDTSIQINRYYRDRRDNPVDINEYDHFDRQHLRCMNFQLMSLYARAFESLEAADIFRLVADSLPLPPDVNPDLVKAIKTLYSFLQKIEFHESCFYELIHYQDKDGIYSDAEITALLTNHLFSPLTSSDPRYLSSISDSTEIMLTSCPCTEECETSMHYYDYEIGNEGLGFKKPNILLYPLGGGIMAIEKAEEMPKNIYGEGMTDTEQLRTPENKQKLASHALIMSYFNHQLQLEEKGEIVSTLIPTIFTTWKCFDIYFYDSEKDIFLKTFDQPVQIFESKSNGIGFENRFNLSAIFQIWVLINHLLLKPNLDLAQFYHQWEFEKSFGFKEELELKKLPEYTRKKLPSPKEDERENNKIV